MLFIVFSWIYIFLTCLAWGFSTLRLLNVERGSSIPLSKTKIEHILIVGLIVITSVLSLANIFVSLSSAEIHIIMITASIILGILNFRLIKKYITFILKKFEPTSVVIFIIFLVALLPFLKQAPQNYDTGLYHAQSIMWTQKYPIILGLGNLHTRLAFNSSVFVASAFYDLGVTSSMTILPINSFLVVLLIARGSALIHKKSTYSSISRIFETVAPLIIIFTAKEILSSSSPDITSLIITYNIVSTLMNYRYNLNTKIMLVVFFSFFSVTLKLSQAPNFLFVLYILLIKRNFSCKQITLYILVALLITLPWILRNIMLSGYIVFPFPEIDIFNYVWEIPHHKAYEIKSWILSWARVPHRPYQEVLGMKFSEWFTIWWSNLKTPEKFQFILTPLTSISALLLSKKYNHYKNLLLILFAGFLFWFSQAPTFRFGWSYTLLPPIVFTVILVPILKPLFKKGDCIYYKFAGFIISTLWASFMLFNNSSAYFKNLIFQEQLPSDVDLTAIENSRINATQPSQGNQCFNTPVEDLCTPTKANDVVFIKQNFKSGFKSLR